MSVELATAYVAILPSFKGGKPAIEKELAPAVAVAGKTGQDSGAKFSGGFKKATAAAGGLLAVSGLVQFAKGAVSAASDVSESTSKVGVVFGDQAKQIVASSKTSATAMGLSSGAYLEATGTLGNLLVSLNIAPKAAADMSQQMVKLAGDLASFNNVSPEEALAAIKSGLTGETEPLKAFGVNMNDATLHAQALKLGLIKSVKDGLTPQAKALAAQALIMDQTKTAQGDFARTSGGLANQQRILAAQFDNVKAQVGAQLLPIMVKLANFTSKDVLPTFKKVGDFVSNNSKVIGILSVTVLGLWAAYKSFKIATIAITAVSDVLTVMRGRTIAAATAERTLIATQRAAAVSGLAMAGPLLAVAISGYITGKAITHLTEGHNSLAKALDNGKRSQESFRQALDESGGALDDNVRKAVGLTLQQDGISGKAAAAGISLRDLTTAVTGNDAAFASLIARWKASGDPAASTIVAAGLLHGQYKGLAVSAKELADSTDQGAAAAKGAAGANTKVAGAVGTAKETIKQAVSATDAFTHALDRLSGNALSSEQAELSLKDSVAKATQQFKDNGSSLSQNTEKGRANREWLLDAIGTVNQHAAAVLKQTNSTKAATTALRTDEAQLRAGAIAAGLNAEQVNRLVNRFAALPKKVTSAVHADTAGAAAKMTNLHDIINNIPTHKTVTVDFALHNDVGQAVHDAVNSINGPHRAKGGPVTAGRPYIVGERRPELFVPDRNGHIEPRVPTGGGRGSGNSYHFYEAHSTAEIFSEIDRREWMSTSV